MVNLWECLTAAERNHRKGEGYAPKVGRELLGKLGETSRFHYQEVSLTPTEDGWEIKVFGCLEEDEIKITIPKDRSQAVQVTEKP